jgi:hypothetical protein
MIQFAEMVAGEFDLEKFVVESFGGSIVPRCSYHWAKQWFTVLLLVKLWLDGNMSFRYNGGQEGRH